MKRRQLIFALFTLLGLLGTLLLTRLEVVWEDGRRESWTLAEARRRVDGR